MLCLIQTAPTSTVHRANTANPKYAAEKEDLRRIKTKGLLRAPRPPSARQWEPQTRGGLGNTAQLEPQMLLGSANMTVLTSVCWLSAGLEIYQADF